MAKLKNMIEEMKNRVSRTELYLSTLQETIPAAYSGHRQKNPIYQPTQDRLTELKDLLTQLLVLKANRKANKKNKKNKKIEKTKELESISFQIVNKEKFLSTMDRTIPVSYIGHRIDNPLYVELEAKINELKKIKASLESKNLKKNLKKKKERTAEKIKEEIKERNNTIHRNIKTKGGEYMGYTYPGKSYISDLRYVERLKIELEELEEK